MNKTYFVFNAYQYTNRDNELTIVMEANPVKYASRYPKRFFFTKQKLIDAGFANFYDPDKKGLGLQGIYIKTKTIEEIIGASDNQSDLEEEQVF